MELFYSIISLFIGLLLILFLLSLFIHQRVFRNRYEPDGITKYYSEKDYPHLLFQPIEVPTKKGYLRGALYSYFDDPAALVIFAHGMWGSHSAYIQEIEALAKQGFLVLGFDYYGTERSDGKSIRGLGNSLASLDPMVCYAKKTFPQKDIYVMGHSWGGFAALGIAQYHPEIKKVVAMSPFISLSQVLRGMLPVFLRPLIPFLIGIDFFKCGKYSLVKAKRVLKNTEADTLILHSKDDPMIPYRTSTKYLEAHLKNAKISYCILVNKGHNPDYSEEALAYTKEAMIHLKALRKAEQQAYRRTLDYHKMGELDDKIINIIADFLKNS